MLSENVLSISDILISELFHLRKEYLSGEFKMKLIIRFLTGRWRPSAFLIAKIHILSINIIKIKPCLALYAISFTLPLSSRGARSVTSLLLYDVSKQCLPLLRVVELL